MYSFLLKLGAWLAQKLAAAALIVVLGLAAYGLWLFVREQGDFNVNRDSLIQELTLKRAQLTAAKTEIEKRLVDLQTGIETQRDRVKRAQRVIDLLRDMESWWDRLWGNPSQQKANGEQLQKMEQLKTSALGQVADLHRTLTQTRWEKDGLEIELSRVSRQIVDIEASKSKVAHYLRAAWREAGWYVVLALVTYFFGPTLWAFIMYFGVAGLIARGRPIRFVNATPVALPQVGESHVSVEATLTPNEVLRIKEKFLQASDEGVKKSTRFVLDWRIPFTSVACGLIELVELRNQGDRGEFRVTLSNASDPHIELAVVEVPEGGALILRPSFLAGVIQSGDRPLEIRRHWQLFRWQAWVTGQFRFFEFVGPCRLIVAGSRGVRAEQLIERAEGPPFARRTNQDATIGFTPNLSYRPVRAETFWSYYRGMNPLFDDLFAGHGIFILQETATPGAAAKAGRFWATVWNGVLKVFGM
ncbi:MAG TPA: hypothetical protein VHO24_07270 [Opitutaceae bacterium]|nr:hypothetical protein [Opitutaceae bacterium]